MNTTNFNFINTMKNSQYKLDQYKEALKSLPAPGMQLGCRRKSLGVANRARIAGLSPDEAFIDIRRQIDSNPGNRRVRDEEIRRAIRTAFSNSNFIPTTTQHKIPIIDGNKAFNEIVNRGKDIEEAELWELSPVRLFEHPDQDTLLLLQTLYHPEDVLFIGDSKHAGKLEDNIRTVSKWLDYFSKGGEPSGPYIILNPIGRKAINKSGNLSHRCDASVTKYRFALVEFDATPIETQIKFFAGAKLPLVALIYSGGKSIHAWVEIKNIHTLEQWNTKMELLFSCLKPLNADSNTKNAARAGRLPGIIRPGTKNFQRLLWLSPNGREVLS